MAERMTPPHTILVVDDEPAIRRLLHASLSRSGYGVVEAGTAREALNAVQIDKPAVVLLDLGLPDRDGLELIPLIRAQAAVIVVSAREATEQKVAALDLGADDYISKPFDSEEVLARIRTAMRHRLAGEAETSVVRCGDIEIDLTARLVRKRGDEVHLTPKEYGFLAELARKPGRVITHAQLLRAVWGAGHEGDVEYLRVAARGIRRKLEDDPASPTLLRNEPAVGYRLVNSG
jgi:two-component system, OmpR family, KDP operon response regulator KdpE